MVRADLPLGNMAAQLVHAAGESAAEWLCARAEKHVVKLIVPGEETPPTYDQTLDTLDAFAHWGPQSELLKLPENTHAVALTACNEEELLKLSDRLSREAIPHKIIREPDLNNEATAIGVHPAPREKLRRLFAKLPLLR